MKNLKHGWVEGSVQEFLGLSDADMEYIEMRRTLGRKLKEVRNKLNLT
jgi:hypothetical protein